MTPPCWKQADLFYCVSNLGLIEGNLAAPLPFCKWNFSVLCRHVSWKCLGFLTLAQRFSCCFDLLSTFQLNLHLRLWLIFSGQDSPRANYVDVRLAWISYVACFSFAVSSVHRCGKSFMTIQVGWVDFFGNRFRLVGYRISCFRSSQMLYFRKAGEVWDQDLNFSCGLGL